MHSQERLFSVGFIFGSILGIASMALFVTVMNVDRYVCELSDMTPDLVTVRTSELKRNAPMVFVKVSGSNRTLWIHRNRIQVCEEIA
jgi:hypothetical protein